MAKRFSACEMAFQFCKAHGIADRAIEKSLTAAFRAAEQAAAAREREACEARIKALEEQIDDLEREISN